ncbi:MAG TPA: TCP-1/cpn60 chaperonin family protein [Gemmatimonadales bacterium]|nr:TCP-1/cpn60 chaperonin family protein [Gemmatimonadales bacterium]
MISEELGFKLENTGMNDEKIGVEIVRKALEEPLRMIAQNAGAKGSIVLAKVKESKEKNYGYKAQTEVNEDLVKSGVIDPTKVTRTALQNAASIAGLLLTTECVVVEKKEEKPAPGTGTARDQVSWTRILENHLRPGVHAPAQSGEAPQSRARDQALAGVAGVCSGY